MASMFSAAAQPNSKVLLGKVATWLGDPKRSTMTYPTLNVERLTRPELLVTPTAGHFGDQIAEALEKACGIKVGRYVEDLLNALDLSRADYSKISRRGVNKDSDRILMSDLASVLREIAAGRES